MSDSVKDAIAQMAMQDLFGSTPEGQKVKEVYQSTGRLVNPITEQEHVRRMPSKDEGESYRVVKPMDYKQITKAVTEAQIVESLMDDSSKEKDHAITEIANEATQEARESLSKILRRLR